RGVQGLVVVSELAGLRGRGEVGLEPVVLLRAEVHRDVVVESNDVPGALVVTVVSLTDRARRSPEVGEVSSGPGGVVLVVTRRRMCPRFVPAPARVVAVLVVGVRAVLVSVVACGEDGS